MDTVIDQSDLVGNVGRTHIQKAPDDTPLQLVDANPNRIQVIIRNNSEVTVYLGNDDTVTSDNGFPLLSGEQITDNKSSSEWWAVTTGAAADLRIIQVP